MKNYLYIITLLLLVLWIKLQNGGGHGTYYHPMHNRSLCNARSLHGNYCFKTA